MSSEAVQYYHTLLHYQLVTKGPQRLGQQESCTQLSTEGSKTHESACYLSTTVQSSAARGAQSQPLCSGNVVVSCFALHSSIFTPRSSTMHQGMEYPGAIEVGSHRAQIAPLFFEACVSMPLTK